MNLTDGEIIAPFCRECLCIHDVLVLGIFTSWSSDFPLSQFKTFSVEKSDVAKQFINGSQS